jgi:Uma2 family endonuclease
MATLAPSRPPPWPPARITVDQYQRMIEFGILGEDDAVELLDGVIVQKMPRNPPHDSTITRGQRRLLALVGDGWSVRPQNAITLADSQPEPDLAVAVGPDGRYDDHHPRPDELLLVVEVADSSLDRDRNYKLPIYAAASIPVYWIVNLVDRQVEVYTDPTGSTTQPTYRDRRDCTIDDSVPLVGFGSAPLSVLVRDLLPALPTSTS